MSTEPTILVVMELQDGDLHPLSLEALQAGSLVAKSVNGRMNAALMGEATGAVVNRLHGYGLEHIYVVDDPLLGTYQSEHYTAALAALCQSAAPVYVLMPNTLMAVDLAPRVAWQLEAGLVTDCVGIEAAEGGPVFIKPVYSGNVMAVYSAATSPFLVTLRPRAFAPLQPHDGSQAQVVPVACAFDPAPRVTVVERHAETTDGIKLVTADRIVAGGRGIGGAEGFGHLRALAELLGAAIGASRPPCDLGWVASTAQVGQTGEIVAPGLYIAVGISGSTQHLAGMSSAKTIVAINSDPQAAIFRIADYGVVGKYEEVIPTFTAALKGMLA